MSSETMKDRISERLTALNLSAREVSLAAGLSPDTLGKVLTGKTRSLRGDNLSAVAKVLKTTESYLTGVRGEPSPWQAAMNEARHGHPGMAEPDAIMVPPRPDEMVPPNHSLWEVQPGYDGPPGYLPGDHFILDQSRHAVTGDDVLATIVDMAHPRGITVLRKLKGSWLYGGPDTQPELVDHDRVAIMGVIVRMWREASPVADAKAGNGKSGGARQG